jgi:hypothetical protein
MKTKQYKNKTINTNLNDIEKETLYLSRWIALYEAINIISEEAIQRKKDFNKLKLSAVKIKKYIGSVENHIQKKLMEDNFKSTMLDNTFKNDSNEFII